MCHPVDVLLFFLVLVDYAGTCVTKKNRLARGCIYNRPAVKPIPHGVRLNDAIIRTIYAPTP